MKLPHILAAILVLAFACSTPAPNPAAVPDKPAVPEAPATPEPPATVPTSGVDAPPSAPQTAASSAPAGDRAAAGIARLAKTPAGRVVLRGIDAHGGLKAWYAGEALRFRYEYRPLGGKGAKASLQTIHLFDSRAYHEMSEPAVGVFAWDGQRAWSKFETADAKVPVHFWALTPYYFVGLPFPFADPGVQLQLLQDEPDFGLPPCDVVRVTFAPGTGDASDDYYIAHFAKRDGRLLAVRYVVSWKPFVAPRGMAHTPEKLLVFSEFDGAGALTVARTHTFHKIKDGKRGEEVTVGTVSQIAHPATFDEARVVPPEGAVFDTSLADFGSD
jgi:hypothetical protein